MGSDEVARKEELEAQQAEKSVVFEICATFLALKSH